MCKVAADVVVAEMTCSAVVEVAAVVAAVVAAEVAADVAVAEMTCSAVVNGAALSATPSVMSHTNVPLMESCHV